MEEPDAQIALQHRDAAADGSGCQGKPAGGSGKTASLGAAHEGFKVRERLHAATFNHPLKEKQPTLD